MHVGHKLNTKYYMNEQDGNMELSAVHEEKDLGVYFTSDLTHVHDFTFGGIEV